MGTGPTRREVLAGAGLLAGVGALAACGVGSSGSGTGGGTGGRNGSGNGRGNGGAPGGNGGAPGGNGGAPGGQSTGPLAAVANVPVGGAASATLDGQPILLTQAKAGTIVGLSAICTHQGCTVLPRGNRLLCPCHGSVYALDGSNVSGPAPSPLPPVPVHVVSGEVLPGAG